MLVASHGKSNGLFLLKAGCLLFWAAWFFLACATNFFDLINVLWGLPANFHFRSGNYALMGGVLAIYHTPLYLQLLLFIIDILIQAACGILFLLSFVTFFRRQIAWHWINGAFTLSIALWAAFIIIEEIFIAYAFEATHLRLMTLELITLMALHFLPHESKKED